MKRILLFIFLFCHQGIFGQLEFRNSNVGRLMNMEDISGRSLFKKYDPDISGSPFINDEWIMAMITLSQGNEIGEGTAFQKRFSVQAVLSRPSASPENQGAEEGYG